MTYHLRNTLLIPSCLLLLATGSCEQRTVAASPAVAVTDTRPVGEGLKVLGFALLDSAVVCVLGRMIR
ncbi:MAG: hypothetical protein ABIS50_23645 [Luteolibacter sp.]|uniref:hypothetical protein n=1 Tax=Luteolibacter sp. TaxID=1962973 RepID=UPI0032636A15